MKPRRNEKHGVSRGGEAATSEGLTPLMIAARHNSNADVLRALIRTGANVETKNAVGMTALMIAARYCKSADVLHALLEEGAHLEATSDAGLTPVMYAARDNACVEAVRALIDAGAVVDARTAQGATALMFAARANPNVVVIRALVDAGADLEATTEFGATALMVAARHSKTHAVLEVLLQAGANVKTTNHAGSTALMYAAYFNSSVAIVRTLIDAGAALDASTVKGGTALMLAAHANPNVEVTRALLDAGADPNALRGDGWTALMIAAKSNPNPDVVTLLAKQGNVTGDHADADDAMSSGATDRSIDQRRTERGDDAVRASNAVRADAREPSSSQSGTSADSSLPSALVQSVFTLEELAKIPPLGTYDDESDPEKIRVAHKISGGKRMVWVFEGDCKVRSGSRVRSISCADYASNPQAHDLVDVELKVMAVEIDPVPHPTAGNESLVAIANGSWSRGAPVARVTEQDEWVMALGYNLKDAEHQVDMLLGWLNLET